MANQAFKKRLGPGVWVDQDDNMHFSVPELLDMVGLPHTPENEAHVRKTLHAMLNEANPEAPIKDQSGCPACGVHGMTRHAPGCPVGWP